MQSDFKRAVVSVFLGLVCFLAAAGVGQATSVVLPSDDELITGARAIVRGQVTDIFSGYDEAHKAIFTYITLKVTEVYKGQITSAEIVLKEPGGVSRTHGSIIFGTPQFAVGEDTLVYLDTWPDGSLRVYQWFMGKFNIAASPTGQLIVSRAAPTEQVTVLGRSNKGVLTDSRELNAYRQMLRTRVQATAGAAALHEQKYYGQTVLRAQPVEMAAFEAVNNNIERFTLINPNQPPRWFEPDSGQPVVFKVNLTGAFNSQALDDMTAAMNVWSSANGTSIRVTSGGATTGCGLTSLDGENTISFNNCDNYSAFAPAAGSSCSGVLAAAGIVRYSLSESRIINGTRFYRGLEANMSFNPYARCYLSDSCRIREVATHELGHALGIGHSADNTATMYYSAHFDGRCAALRADDVAAISFIYPGSGGSTPTALAITTTTLAGGQVNQAYSQTLAATGGAPPYSWSLAAGSGALPAGLTLSGGGVISGTPTASGTFNFTVRVTDAQAGAAQRAFSLNIASSAPATPSGRLLAGPNPIQVCDGSGLGATTFNWSSANVTAISIRAGSPSGTQVTSGGPNGTFTTSKTVTNGTVFYLQNTSGGLPLTSANTLATVTVNLTTSGCPTTPPPSGSLQATPNPIPVCDGSGVGVTKLTWSFPVTGTVEIRLGSATGRVLAYVRASGSATTGKWVSNGTVFVFRERATGKTLGSITITVTTQGCAITRALVPGEALTAPVRSSRNTSPQRAAAPVRLTVSKEAISSR